MSHIADLCRTKLQFDIGQTATIAEQMETPNRIGFYKLLMPLTLSVQHGIASLNDWAQYDNWTARTNFKHTPGNSNRAVISTPVGALLALCAKGGGLSDPAASDDLVKTLGISKDDLLGRTGDWSALTYEAVGDWIITLPETPPAAAT
jgi:hypothetical protein